MSRARSSRGDKEWMREHGFKTEADVIARANELAKELGLDQDPGPLPELPEGFLAGLEIPLEIPGITDDEIDALQRETSGNENRAE